MKKNMEGTKALIYLFLGFLIFIALPNVFSYFNNKDSGPKQITATLLNVKKNQKSIIVKLYLKNSKDKKVGEIKTLSLNNRHVSFDYTSHKNNIFVDSAKIWLDKNNNNQREKEEMFICAFHPSLKEIMINEKESLMYLNCGETSIQFKSSKLTACKGAFIGMNIFIMAILFILIVFSWAREKELIKEELQMEKYKIDRRKKFKLEPWKEWWE